MTAQGFAGHLPRESVKTIVNLLAGYDILVVSVIKIKTIRPE